MRATAASERQVLWKLRLPASVPYLFSALRVSASASVVGAIIGELPSGIGDGLGGQILQDANYYITGPERLWAHDCRSRRPRDDVRRVRRPRRGARDPRPVSNRESVSEAVMTDSRSTPGERGATAVGTSDVGRPTAGAPGRAESLPVVEIAGAGKVFGSGPTAVGALEDIDLTIRAGEFISLIGPSGCGKSTLLRLIGDLIPATSGSVKVNGKSAEQARRGREYGIVFQAPVLFEWRTIDQNVELPLEISGQPDRRASGRERSRCSDWWSSASSPSAIPGSCRAACSSGSRSPGPWPSTRSCC